MLDVDRFDCNHRYCNYRLRRMRFFSHYSLRRFVFLLLAVFIANTVYASGMMAAGQLHALAESKTVQCHATSADGHHCHQPPGSGDALQHQQHHSQHKNGCSDCNHCFACFSVIIPAFFNPVSTPNMKIAALPAAEIYLSPASAQPQKPPIA